MAVEARGYAPHMNVTARLLGTDRSFLPPGAEGSSVTLEFTRDQVTLANLRTKLGMPPDLPRIAFLRGEPIGDDHALSDGDEVILVTPVGGG